MPRAFIPFGDMTPDLGAFNNPGLSQAANVVPFASGYVCGPYLKNGVSPNMSSGITWAMESHPSNTLGNSTSFYVHNGADLYENTVSSTGGSKTNRSRVTGSVLTTSVTVGGAGYAVGDTGSITTGDGSARYAVSTVAAGVVTAVTITVPGKGYSTGAGQATAVLTGGGDGALTLNVLTIGPYANTLSEMRSGGQFISFGNFVVYANKADALQYRDATGAAAFAKMNDISVPTGSSSATADPRAKFVSWIKNHLVIANVDLTSGTDVGGIAFGGAYGPGPTLPAALYNDMVWWSATDNIRRFSDPATHPMIIGSDYQILSDNLGPISGLSGGGEWINIFKLRGIYKMTGPPFSFDLVTTEVGCPFPHSILRFGDDVYFWSLRGPCVLRGGVELDYLSNGQIESVIKTGNLVGNTISAPPYSVMLDAVTIPNFRVVEGAVSQFDGILVWVVSGSDSDGIMFASEIIYYNTRNARWSVGRMSTNSSVGGVPVKIGTTNISGVCSYTSPISVLNELWQPCAGIAMCSEDPGILTSVQIMILTNDTDNTMDETYGPIFTTTNLKLNQDGSSRIIRVRPILSSTESEIVTMNQSSIRPSYEIIVTSSNASHGSSFPFATSGVSVTNDHGWVSFPSSVFCDFHRVTVSFRDLESAIGASNHTYNITKYQGIEIEYEAAGVRSKPN